MGQQWNKEGKQKTEHQIELEAVSCPMKETFTVMKQSFIILVSLISIRPGYLLLISKKGKAFINLKCGLSIWVKTYKCFSKTHSLL